MCRAVEKILRVTKEMNLPEYQLDFGCKGGAPHDPIVLHDLKTVKWEICQICGEKFRWQKAYKGRIDNKEYLRVHIRAFAQRSGPTRRIYNKTYNPGKCRIVI